MTLDELIQVLSHPTAFPYAVDEVEVRQTHISVVFLAGPFVYKIKKPVNPGFLDFSTLEKRRHFCEEEVRLNRRLAPEVYRGVVPVVQTSRGLRFEGEGKIIEWAVKMQRLPDEATLQRRLGRGEVAGELIQALARRIAAFHDGAKVYNAASPFGHFAMVQRTVLDVFDRALAQVGTTVNPTVFERLRKLTDQTLARLQPVIEERATRGMTRDVHGDLHLDHIYYFPDRKPPADLVIIDCIEFNERFRIIDPIADMAFAVMDLIFYGRRDLARLFTEAYIAASGDEQGRRLLPLYTAYRATVRGMVEGLLLAEKEVPEVERSRAITRARAHWLLALVELEEPESRPCLVVVAGLPGTGKSTLGRALAEHAGFSLIRSDVVRKQLAGLPIRQPAPEQKRAEIYGRAWDDRTYAACLEQAEQALFAGRRVIVDATFREEDRRRTFLDCAVRWGVPGLILLCEAAPATVRQRLEDRRDDASDADWPVYLHVAKRWEPFGPVTASAVRKVSTIGSIDEASQGALRALQEVHLFNKEGGKWQQNELIKQRLKERSRELPSR
jgi:aminoglycoside phosphotransferase family enzyme/predicted kinase